MIKAANLTKCFENTKALDGVDFEIGEGAVYGLVGSNGSGKSTLLRLISGVYRADDGEISVDGEDAFKSTVSKQKIAFIGDTPYFLPGANLTDMSKLYSGMYNSFDPETYRHLCEVFALNQKTKLTSLSKGMQRQATLILSLSCHPKYLLLDEAFDGLDVVMRKVLANIIIDRVSKENLTVIISSHNLRELEDLCDHIELLHNGKIIFSNGADNLKGKLHKLQAVFEIMPEDDALSNLDIIKKQVTGSLLQAVIRGNEEEILKAVDLLDPKFSECIEPTLEEMFIYEMEVIGYDVKNILS